MLHHIACMAKKIQLWCECLFLFGWMPVPLYYLVISPPDVLSVWLGFEPRRLLFPIIWLMAIAIMWRWKRLHRGKKIFTAIPWGDVKSHLLPRFLISAVFMTGLLYVLNPERLLQFPLERPQLWMIVMTFYPLFSVIPQEVIFRLFFFERYQSILPNEKWMILISGLAFGHAHLLFNNWVAYLMSMAGGVMFSITYARTKNLSLVWLEHAIYGQFLFTIGLGWYFYTGAAALHH